MTTLDQSQTISSVMATDLVTCDPSTSITEVAALMKARNIGDVLIVTEGQLAGIVTDRDIVVRALASGDSKLCAGDVMTRQLTTVESVCERSVAADLMAQKAIRRLPVVDSGRLVGIVTLGDLATDHAPNTVLGEISEAPPNN